MPALTRIEPREEMLLEPLPDLFRRFMRLTDWPALRMPEHMKLDVIEDDRQYLVKAEVPGVKKEDISVRIDGNYVSISADVKEEKKETKKHDGERTLLHELHHGSMSRGFTLAHEVDEKKANAKFENGVLSLTLPKRSPATGTTLSIA